MSKKNGTDYLYLIWKSERSRRQYIVGQLVKNSLFEFQYSDEIDAAINDGFKLLLCFPDINAVYKNPKLFSVFASRLPDRKRKDIKEILSKYDLKEYDEYMLLKRSGARLPIDSLEFIDPILDTCQRITRIFFMAGVRHYLGCNGTDCSEAVSVTRGDEILLHPEPENPQDGNAVQMLNTSGKILGYVPRYYSAGVSDLLRQNKKILCHIYHVDKSMNCNECIKVIMKINP